MDHALRHGQGAIADVKRQQQLGDGVHRYPHPVRRTRQPLDRLSGADFTGLDRAVAYLGLADNSCGPLLSPVEPSEGSLSTGCQVSKRVVNPLCSPPFLLVDLPIPRRWMSFFLVHPLPYLGLRPRRHPVEPHFFA